MFIKDLTTSAGFTHIFPPLSLSEHTFPFATHLDFNILGKSLGIFLSRTCSFLVLLISCLSSSQLPLYSSRALSDFSFLSLTCVSFFAFLLNYNIWIHLLDVKVLWEFYMVIYFASNLFHLFPLPSPSLKQMPKKISCHLSKKTRNILQQEYESNTLMPS